MRASNRADWLVPPALLLLSAIPIAAGVFRLTQLAGGVAVTPDNSRFFTSPLPVVIHIVSVSLFSVLGAFQFVAGIRRRWPAWHRYAGRLVAACGLSTAVSGLWMTQFYVPPPGDGIALYIIRLVVGGAMTVAIVQGVLAIRRRDIVNHSAWMIRAYALGLGAGTQVFTHLPWYLLYGKPDEPVRAVLMGAGWAINIVAAEWIIRARSKAPVAVRAD